MTPVEEITLRTIRKVMLDSDFGPDSCIAATAMAAEYLGSRGFEGDGYRALAVVYNAAFWDGLSSWTKAPDLRDPEFVRACSVAMHTPGAWNVAIGWPGEEDTGNHVVYLGERAGETWLVDLSIDQAARPAHGLEFGPVISVVPNDLLATLRSYGTVILAGPGATVTYQLVPGSAFKASPNWGERDADLRRRIVGFSSEVVRQSTLDNALDRALRA